jgi:hypothetical protein
VTEDEARRLIAEEVEKSVRQAEAIGRAKALIEAAECALTLRTHSITEHGVREWPATPVEIAAELQRRATVAVAQVEG